MSCFRIDVRRRLALYVDGGVSAARSRSIERHLLDCTSCRAAVVRLRETRALLRSMSSREAPPLDLVALRAQRNEETAKPVRVARVVSLLAHMAGDIAIAIVLFGIFAFLYTHTAAARARFDWSSFRAVPLSEIARTHDPHVITEGIVLETLKEPGERGIQRFKLVDAADRRTFIVCEVLDGGGMRVPPPGAHVRVYGVTRFDTRKEHQWFEIHPVLRMEVLD
jgi:hypothetical protein